jgi:hypothetical protein
VWRVGNGLSVLWVAYTPPTVHSTFLSSTQKFYSGDFSDHNFCLVRYHCVYQWQKSCSREKIISPFGTGVFI